MSDQKKSRAFRIHSNTSRHEMPKQLKKKYLNIPKNLKNTEYQNGKMLDQKKVGHSASTHTRVDTKCPNS